MSTLSPKNLQDVTDEDIETYLESILVDQFEVDPASLTPEAHLFNDLGIDSIDAVDMLVYLKDFTGVRIPPEQFQSVRTLGDIKKVIKALKEQC